MTSRPNIVWLTSQATGRHLGCLGNPTVHTPALDALAGDGLTLTNLWSTSAIASPSVAAMFSGLYPQGNGVTNHVHAPYLEQYRPGVQHISHILRHAGYATFLFHLHPESRLVEDLAFDQYHAPHRAHKTNEVESFIRVVRGMNHRRVAGGLNRQGLDHLKGPRTSTADWESFYHSAHQVADAFVAFVKSRPAPKQPFYAQIGFYETLRPFDFGGAAPDAVTSDTVPSHLRHHPDQQQDLAHLRGAVRAMDTAVGTIIAALSDAGIADNTLLIFSTDAGIDFTKAREQLYDAGTEMALIMRWPNGPIDSGRQCDWLLSNVDVLPTVLELAGLDVPDGLDGLSAAQCVQDGSVPGPRQAVFAQMPWLDMPVREARSIRTDGHKLIRNMSLTDLEEYGDKRPNGPAPFVQLFDLRNDPGEWHSVADDPAYSDVRMDLDRRLMAWLKGMNDPVLKGRVPSQYYLRAMEGFRTATKGQSPSVKTLRPPAAPPVNRPSKPNIVFITSHDAGRYLNCYGIDTVNSPALDRLADDGCKFTNMFATSAFCSPSRASMMTGLYPQRHGVESMTHTPILHELKPGVQHLSHVLRDAGYHTAMFHHHHEERDINRLGFDAHYAMSTSMLIHDGYTVLLPCHLVADEFVDFVANRRPKDRPFYAQIGFFECHGSWDFGGATPDDTKGVHVPDHLKRSGDQRQELAAFQGAVRKMDTAIKTIWDGLEKQGLADNTLLIYTTDHGIDLEKAKMYLYDAGTEAALIMRWPQGGLTGGRQCDWLLSNVDLFATVLDLVGVPVPDDIDGSSFSACFIDPPLAGGRDAVFAHFPDIHLGARESRSVRTDRYKLIRNFGPTTLSECGQDVEHVICPFVQMFDLEKDPSEWHNVADDPAYAQVRNDLDHRLMRWLIEVDDAILHGPRPDPFTIKANLDFHQAASS